MLEVFRVFLRLGLTSFGGPIAHLGYFRDEFVRRRGWLDEAHYAQLLAICQFLPGPASSQLGFAIGLARAGWRGGLAAFAGFTLPSALAMFALALSAPHWIAHPAGVALVHGLKLVAVAVVAYGVWGMARSLTPDWRRRLIAIAAGVAIAGVGGPWMQLLAVAAGGAAGLALCRAPLLAGADGSIPNFAPGYGRGVALACLVTFALGLGAALLWSGGPASLAGLAAACYRAGALVFGGGHVVLPLLEQRLVATGWLELDRFLLGYGAAQALPGPMFALAAYVGAALPLPTPAPWRALVALLALFLPGLLLVAAALPLWSAWMRRAWAARAVAGINAAVVGLLAAALFDPIARQAIGEARDLGIVAVAVAMLAWRRLPVLAAVAWCVLAALGSAWPWPP
ncbi:chromate efflux transporter [Lysobacter firmicutimachus]|uniref:Chromate efflux transporter n=1 Tax=Lysobacter firmicutimachus TaxID=1792846 RepID=A0ABU8D6A4_9GAMM